MRIGPKVFILYGRCRERLKKHAARAPVAEGGKEGESEKSWEGGKVVGKVGIPCGRCRKKSKKHAAITPVGEDGNERWDRGAKEQRTDVYFYPVKLSFLKK